MTLIRDTEALSALCARLARDPYITIDTEFLRDNSYWPQLCLVQLAGREDVAAVDTLAPKIDLRPLLDLLSDAKVLKVFHAARQDIEIFYHMDGRIPAPLFDTQVAAMVCGFGDSVGYETLVGKLTGERIDKSSRFTDWSLRPLTKKQLAYALSDVTHLRTIYEKLNRRLERNGRELWLKEEMDVLTAPETYEILPEETWRRLKVRNRSGAFLTVLRAVAAWRERAAQERNLPRNRVLRDESLMEIAAHAPATVDDLARTRGLGRGFAEGRQGREVIAAVREGLAVPKQERPHLPEKRDVPPGLGPVTELLKVLLKLKCEEHNVAQKLVASSADIEAIAADDNADVRALNGWRREVFGAVALALKHGQIGLTIEDGRIGIVSRSDTAAAADSQQAQSR